VAVAHQLDIDPGDPPVLSRVAAGDRVEERARALPIEESAEALATRLGVDVRPIIRLTAGTFDPTLVLPLRDVAVHVLSEARRVDQAETALVAGEFDEFGRLLDASHESLRRFGASSAALDRLVGAMRAAGAYGARLTGAGFGGYAVAACARDALDAVISAGRLEGGPSFEVAPSDGVR
jgi:galactokinase